MLHKPSTTMSFLSPISNFITTYPIIPFTIAFCFFLFYLAYLHYKLHIFTRGQGAISLESLMKECVEGIAKMEERNELISKHALSLDTRVSHAIRNAQMIRYKAFETNGSNQSFSIALLNEKGSGVVITSLHAHDRISTFAKPIEKYASSYDLTEEEMAVINEAKTAHKNSH